ncbi:hypothetical protein HK096_010018, partial [Nowakowskiella sp. JEL0078]
MVKSNVQKTNQLQSDIKDRSFDKTESKQVQIGSKRNIEIIENIENFKCLPKNASAEFTSLLRYFVALNTMYSFFTFHRQMVCSFEAIRSSVVGMTDENFSIFHLGQMRFIYSSLLHFYWVEKSNLVDGTIKELQTENACKLQSDYTLIIEFRDSRPIQPKKKKRQIVSNHKPLMELNGSLNDKMQKQIEHRNRIFEDKLCDFLEAEVRNMFIETVTYTNYQGENSVKKINDEATTHIPTEPGWRSPYFEKSNLLLHSRPENLFNLISDLKKEPWYCDQITEEAIKTLPARKSRFGPLNTNLSSQLKNALKKACNIEDFFTHQAMAINEIENGCSVIVSTSTSSGKSLIYQVPVLRNLEIDHSSKALYIFPTKALAQDQKRSLSDIIFQCDHLKNFVKVETFDGDTPFTKGIREKIRSTSHVVITNPDTLHVTILPQHKNWSQFLRNLKYVIVDATISNPEEFMKKFFGLDSVKLISEVDDGSPCGEKHLLVWNPPLKNKNKPLEGRSSSIEETANLMKFLILRGVRTICFAKFRRICELVFKAINEMNLETPELAQKIKSYRGGYSVEDRRKIENELFNGELMGVIATNALELGIDIGSLDAVLHVGFPHHMSSYKQQFGRVGRREKDSISIMIADGDNFVDQHFAKNPKDLFNTSLETAYLDLSNESILEAHLQCAASEIPLNLENDKEFFCFENKQEPVGDVSVDLLQKILDKYLMKNNESE